MRTPARSILAVLLVAVVTVGCTPEGGSEGSAGVAQPIGDEPLGDDEVTLHMAQPPELPPALGGATVTMSELRTEDRTAREVVQLVDVPAETTSLETVLPAGAVLRVPEGQALEIAEPVDVASLDGDGGADDSGVVDEVRSPCEAPCTVEGPALVASEGWMVGFGIAAGWQLLVPAPLGD